MQIVMVRDALLKIAFFFFCRHQLKSTKKHKNKFVTTHFMSAEAL